MHRVAVYERHSLVCGGRWAAAEPADSASGACAVGGGRPSHKQAPRCAPRAPRGCAPRRQRPVYKYSRAVTSGSPGDLQLKQNTFTSAQWAPLGQTRPLERRGRVPGAFFATVSGPSELRDRAARWGGPGGEGRRRLAAGRRLHVLGRRPDGRRDNRWVLLQASALSALPGRLPGAACRFTRKTDHSALTREWRVTPLSNTQ